MSASMGIMLETTAERLGAKGGPHWASPDKVPARRLETIRRAGELGIPFTSGILIGIGETREERIDALLALRALGEEHGHVQEVIVQNFRAKPGTRMACIPSRRSTTTCGRSPSRGSCSGRTGTCRRRRTSPSTTSRACSTRGSTTGAASRRSRSTTSTPRRRGRRSSASPRPPRSRGLELARGSGVHGYVAELDRWVDPASPPRGAPQPCGSLARDDAWAPGEPISGPVRRPPRCRGRSKLQRSDDLGEGRAHAAPLRGSRPRRCTASSPPPTGLGGSSAGTR